MNEISRKRSELVTEGLRLLDDGGGLFVKGKEGRNKEYPISRFTAFAGHVTVLLYDIICYLYTTTRVDRFLCQHNEKQISHSSFLQSNMNTEYICRWFIIVKIK